MPKQIVKPIIWCALLASSVAHAEPRQFAASSTPPKARVVAEPAKAKVYVSASHSTDGRPAATKSATSATKARPAAQPPVTWHISPKFEPGGKDDTTYGFLLKRRF